MLVFLGLAAVRVLAMHPSQKPNSALMTRRDPATESGGDDRAARRSSWNTGQGGGAAAVGGVWIKPEEMSLINKTREMGEERD